MQIVLKPRQETVWMIGVLAYRMADDVVFEMKLLKADAAFYLVFDGY